MKYINCFIIILLTAVLLSAGIYASDIKIDNTPWKKIDNICAVKKVKVKRASDNSKYTVYFIRFNPKKTELKVLPSDKYGDKITDVKTLAQKSGAFCVINGGFFDEDYNPLGLLITEGKILQYMPEYGNFAVFCIKYNKPRVLHRRDFTYDGVAEALQCSPRLMSDGVDTSGVCDLDKESRRSGIGIDSLGNIVIYATDDSVFGGTSFTDLRKIFRLSDINLSSVLSLDGGKSTQLYFNPGRNKIDIKGYENMPVGIGFFKK
ncbi:MAG: phosphodiester glycosidase family protein [Armatimonadota bacterium]